MDYLLTEEQVMIRDLARQIAEEKIRPVAAKYDAEGIFPWDIVKIMAAADICGIYIEEAVKLFEITGEKEYLDMAKKMAQPWLNNTFFKKYAVFPFACTLPSIKPLLNPLFRKKTSFDFDTFMLTKSNTNLIYGLCRLYHHTNDNRIEENLTKWYSSIKEKLLIKGSHINSLWSPNEKFSISYLGADHAAIDALIEISLTLKKDEPLKLAIDLAKGWLKKAGKTGLVGEIPFEYPTKKYSRVMINQGMLRKGVSRLDSQTDFIVVLLVGVNT
jgi:uncharacterized protein YyaL (SSP411 family)